MKEVYLDEMKSITIDGLRYLKTICDSNDITYYLAYGTLLGAVRHKGYIPWDDDIDIWVPRKDYYKLIDILFRDENEFWEVVSNNINHRYLFEWAKLSHKKTMIGPARFVTDYTYGISIDIFPLDDVNKAKSIQEANVLMNKVRLGFIHIASKYRGMTNTVNSEWKKILYKFIFKISSIILGPYYKQIEKYDNNLKNLGDGHGDYLIGSQTPLPVVFCSKWFNDIVELEFEGEKYKAPADYDSVLSTLYGDYMKLPPIEKRTTHHYYTVSYRK